MTLVLILHGNLQHVVRENILRSDCFRCKLMPLTDQITYGTSHVFPVSWAII